jgi:thiamine kinase-like enzyme
MKKLSIIAIAAVLTVSSAFAQTATKVGNGQAGKGQHGSHNLNHKAIRLAIEEINKGNRILRSCLPIYEGHRVAAIRYAELARSELRVGIIEDKLDNRAATTEKDGEKSSKYTKEQIHRSNTQMVIAARHFENAISLLNRSTWEQVDRKNRAVTSLQKALNELRQALAPYGGPAAYQQAAGNRGKINP